MNDNRATTEPFILFQLGDTTYALPSRTVQQMEMVEHITPVPNVPAFVEGVVLSRGQVIPAINLRARFGFERIPYDLRTRLVVIRVNDRIVGLIVDEAREFVDISSEEIQPPPEVISGLSGKHLEGVAVLNERLVLILDAEEVLSLAGEEALSLAENVEEA